MISLETVWRKEQGVALLHVETKWQPENCSLQSTEMLLIFIFQVSWLRLTFLLQVFYIDIFSDTLKTQ